MIEVHFVSSSSGLVKSVRASVIVVTDLIGGHVLEPLGGQTLPRSSAAGDAADGVLIEVPPGVELPGAPAPGLYRVEGLGADEAAHELYAAPGESGG